MRKIFSILLIVSLLAFVFVPFLTLSASAEDAIFTIQGKWEFNETWSAGSIKQDVNFIVEGSTKSYTALQFHAGRINVYAGSSMETAYSGGWYTVDGFFGGTPWVIDFGDEPQVVSSEFYGAMLNNATLLPCVCDGSTCPATDMNMDNICDDCGMLFAIPRDYVLPSPYDAWTEPTQKIFPYAFVYYDENDAPTLVVSVNRPYYLDGHVQVDPAEANSFVRYSVWGDTWRLVNSSDGYGTFKTSNVIPSVDIYDFNNEIVFNADGDFFQIPLWEEVGNLAQGEVERMNLTTTMITLTVCSVGLIALLVGLSLLLKALRIFRV